MLTIGDGTYDLLIFTILFANFSIPISYTGAYFSKTFLSIGSMFGLLINIILEEIAGTDNMRDISISPLKEKPIIIIDFADKKSFSIKSNHGLPFKISES